MSISSCQSTRATYGRYAVTRLSSAAGTAGQHQLMMFGLHGSSASSNGEGWNYRLRRRWYCASCEQKTRIIPLGYFVSPTRGENTHDFKTACHFHQCDFEKDSFCVRLKSHASTIAKVGWRVVEMRKLSTQHINLTMRNTSSPCRYEGVMGDSSFAGASFKAPLEASFVEPSGTAKSAEGAGIILETAMFRRRALPLRLPRMQVGEEESGRLHRHVSVCAYSALG